MEKPIVIKQLNPKDTTQLEDLLYEAIFQPEGSKPLPKEIIRTPDIWNYIDSFGSRKDDYCLVALLENQIVGAVWVRLLAEHSKGFGYVDHVTPEFTISLYPPYRNRGIGTQLMCKMIDHLKAMGYAKTSLSVNKNNYAIRMYLKLGFTIVEEREHDYLMVLNF